MDKLKVLNRVSTTSPIPMDIFHPATRLIKQGLCIYNTVAYLFTYYDDLLHAIVPALLYDCIDLVLSHVLKPVYDVLVVYAL